jgi:hypothetical protein
MSRSVAADASPQPCRQYQRGWSKAMMKESRYKLNGTIQRSGTLATF